MADNEVKLVKLRDPEPTHYSADPNNPMGWTLADVKRRFPCCAIYSKEPIPFVMNGKSGGQNNG